MPLAGDPRAGQLRGPLRAHMARGGVMAPSRVASADGGTGACGGPGRVAAQLRWLAGKVRVLEARVATLEAGDAKHRKDMNSDSPHPTEFRLDDPDCDAETQPEDDSLGTVAMSMDDSDDKAPDAIDDFELVEDDVEVCAETLRGACSATVWMDHRPAKSDDVGIEDFEATKESFPTCASVDENDISEAIDTASPNGGDEHVRIDNHCDDEEGEPLMELEPRSVEQVSEAEPTGRLHGAPFVVWRAQTSSGADALTDEEIRAFWQRNVDIGMVKD